MEWAVKLASPRIRSMSDRGLILSGEIGKPTPSVYVVRLHLRFVIQMHSGLMSLVYGAARAMTATDDGRFTHARASPVTPDRLEAQAKALFKSFSDGQLPRAPWFPATEGQLRWANAMAISAERFFLMHELAHIHNGDFSPWRNWLGRMPDLPSAESAADATACGWLIAYLLDPVPGGPHRQMAYAGAEFGLRLWNAMESVGIHFEGTHPRAGDRVAAMRKLLLDVAGPRQFYAIASPSIAYDQLWRAIERMRKGELPVFEPRLEDVLAGLRTLTVEILASGRECISRLDQPETEQVAFAPVNDNQEALAEAARRDFAGISHDLRSAAEQRVGDLFEAGSVESSLFRILLNLSRNQGGKP